MNVIYRMALVMSVVHDYMLDTGASSIDSDGESPRGTEGESNEESTGRLITPDKIRCLTSIDEAVEPGKLDQLDETIEEGV